MLRSGWRSTSLMLFLAPGASGPEVIKEIIGGEAGGQRAGGPTTSKEYQGPGFNRRGEGGEGRERRQDRISRCLLLFVHVFTGYVASLSKHIRQKRPLRSVHETVHK